MDFFGIGLLEIVAVLLLIAIVFGPHRLPEIAGQFGRAIRELREYARDFRDEYLTDFEEVKEEYLEVRHELEQADTELREELKEIDEDVRLAVHDAREDAEQALEESEAATGGAPKAVAAVEVTPAAAAPTVASTGPPGSPGAEHTARRRRLGRRAPSGDAAARPANVVSINRRRSRET